MNEFVFWWFDSVVSPVAEFVGDNALIYSVTIFLITSVVSMFIWGKKFRSFSSAMIWIGLLSAFFSVFCFPLFIALPFILIGAAACVAFIWVCYVVYCDVKDRKE